MSHLARCLLQRWPQPSKVAIATAGIAMVLFSAFDIRSTLKNFDTERRSFAELATHLKERPDHRLAVHGSIGTGSHFHRDLLPHMAGRGQLQSYAHGYHCTLSTYYAEYFDFSPAACTLFDVDSIVARRPVPSDFPQEAYSSSWLNDDYAVFHLDDTPQMGVFSFIEVSGAIEGPDLRSIREAVQTLAVPAFAAGVLPKVGASKALDHVVVRGGDGVARPWAKENAAALLDSLTSNVQLAPTAAEVLSFKRELAAYEAEVEVQQGTHPWLLLKVNAFPWWHAFVDDAPVPTHHVAPNFMAIPVSPGEHSIRFEYKNPLSQKAGALLSLGMILFWLTSPLRRRR